jgi:hypothetical protein
MPTDVLQSQDVCSTAHQGDTRMRQALVTSKLHTAYTATIVVTIQCLLPAHAMNSTPDIAI